MKIEFSFQNQKILPFLALLFLLIPFESKAILQDQNQQQVEDYTEYSGQVVDSKTGNSLVFASLSVIGTNISTITNNDGKFLLKIPKSLDEGRIAVSFLGYKKQIFSVSDLKKSKNSIKLEPSITKLSEINVTFPKSAKDLVLKTLKKKGDNNLNQQALMTGFYRETIKKRKRNVSLAEAIVNVYKQPYNSLKKDNIELYKARKSTDYSRLDTVALKLQGGPFNALYVDLMKYPEYIFTSEMITYYTFSFAPSTTINDKQVFVVKFAQRSDVVEPLYYGKLFIDAQTYALTSAVYNLNVENKELAGSIFVRRKPKDVKVYPTNAAYRVDYREKNGRWYYSYSNVQLTFKVNRKRKLFNSYYSLSSEMAITDWEINPDKNLKAKDKIRPSIIIADEASGFSDPEFWGAYNVIEPEKSIESAINKIRKQLKRADKS